MLAEAHGSVIQAVGKISFVFPTEWEISNSADEVARARLAAIVRGFTLNGSTHDNASF
jgi:hypothetical protein